MLRALRSLSVCLSLLCLLSVGAFGQAITIQQSSTSRKLVFLMIDSSDHITGKTGLTVTVTISKNGAAFAAPAGTVAEVGNGLYALTPTSADTGTLGSLILHATATGADPSDKEYNIIAPNPDSASAFITGVQGVSPPANWNAMSIDGSGRVLLQPTQAGVTIPTVTTLTNAPADTAGTTTLLTRIPGTVQPQTGDSYARLGTPNGASIDADILTRLASGNVTVGGYASGFDPATLILGATASSWNTTGTIGNKINSSGGAGSDPWATVLPGSYAAGTAGYILGTGVNLNLNQALNTSNTGDTVGGGLLAGRAYGFGKYLLSGTTLTLYAADGVTVVRVFQLDSATNPHSRQ